MSKTRTQRAVLLIPLVLGVGLGVCLTLLMNHLLGPSQALQPTPTAAVTGLDVVVPDLLQKDVLTAKQIAEQSGLVFVIANHAPSGTVIKQFLRPGDFVRRGDTIQVVVLSDTPESP